MKHVGGGNQWPLIYKVADPKGGLCIIDPLYPNKCSGSDLVIFCGFFWVTTNLNRSTTANSWHMKPV